MTAKSVVVVGGSRGLGLGVVHAAGDAGARTVAISREQGDATDEAFAASTLAEHHPDLLVITAGVSPSMRPLVEQSWESFSVNWHSDVRIAFTWLRAALRMPLAPGSRVVVFGSAAELRGSPLSGGYAGAKATVRLITAYAAQTGRDLGITMTAVLPGITPGTGVGETAIRSYAHSAGISAEEFTARLAPALTPTIAGESVLGLASVPDEELAAAYLLDASGLRKLP